jgi:3alpha(or 20beta)-hydroxysteroid dehydrogenase
MGRLAGKVAIVTGGARGMGEATSRLFAAEGAKVVIADVLDREGEALAKSLGGAAFFQHHDVTDEASWQAVTAEAVRRYGGVDVLVNNAGILLFKALSETEKAEFERVIGVNLVGTFLGMKIVGPRMIERGKGSIINISSTAGISAQNGTAAYAASKFGVRGLTKVAALEFGHRGVRVNSVHPGGINTVMGVAPGTPPEIIDQYYKAVPLQRIGQPNEVAQVSLFLASDESSYVCGAEILADGGMLAGQYYPSLPGAPAP